MPDRREQRCIVCNGRLQEDSGSRTHWACNENQTLSRSRSKNGEMNNAFTRTISESHVVRKEQPQTHGRYIVYGIPAGIVATVFVAGMILDPFLTTAVLFMMLPALEYRHELVEMISEAQATSKTPVEKVQQRYVEGKISEEELEKRLERYEDSLMSDIEIGGDNGN